MLTVPVDAVVVESQLSEGMLVCPCGGALAPWGHARDRSVVDVGLVRVRPRRGRCRACGAAHVLLPAALLLRRAHGMEVIGAALELAAVGTAQRRIARRVGAARSTVRGWLARLAVRAEALCAHFARWLLWLIPSRSRVEVGDVGPVAGVVAVVLAAGRAAVERLGASGVWRFAAAATGGRLLCNTSAPLPAPWAR